MDPRYVASSKLLFDQGGPVGEAKTRDYSLAELDAIADFSWPWEGLWRVVVAGRQAIAAQRHHLRERGPWSLARSRSLQVDVG
jgi:hypothetical protein